MRRTTYYRLRVNDREFRGEFHETYPEEPRWKRIVARLCFTIPCSLILWFLVHVFWLGLDLWRTLFGLVVLVASAIALAFWHERSTKWRSLPKAGE